MATERSPNANLRYKLSRAVEVLEEDGFDRLVEKSKIHARRSTERTVRRLLPEALYWELVPRYHRLRCRDRPVDEYDAPLDPFKIEWVDPSSITRHTRRPYPPYRNRFELFGEVRGGDWDLRERPRIRSDYNGAPVRLFLDDQLTGSLLYRSLEDRFVRGRDWTETELYRDVCAVIEAGERNHGWHGCKSEADVLDRCAMLDELYAQLRRGGYRSQYELARKNGETTFREAMENEIVVDVGRDGELLLVSGRHRYCLARILDLDRVPVAFLVRHPRWMAFRDECHSRDLVPDHPDLRELAR